MADLNYDPRTKVVLFVITCIFCTQVNLFQWNMVYVIFLACIFLSARESLKAVIMIVVTLAAFLLSKCMVLLGSNLYTMFLSLLIVAVRMYVPIILCVAFLFQTTKISEFMSAFKKMNAPSYVVIPFAVFFRFLPTVEQEWVGIRKAMAFRGIGVSATNLIFKPIQTVEYILVPLLSSSVYILDELVAASLVRGLDSERDRTCYLEIKFQLQDYIILLVASTFLVGIFWIR